MLQVRVEQSSRTNRREKITTVTTAGLEQQLAEKTTPRQLKKPSLIMSWNFFFVKEFGVRSGIDRKKIWRVILREGGITHTETNLAVITYVWNNN